MAHGASTAPKCRVCGKVEWRHLCSDEPKAPVKAAPEKKLAPVAPSVVSNISNSVSNRDVERVREWRAKNRERYNTGQRDLMRRKRAKEKAE